MDSLISIITPTYNHEKYIEDCIQSVLAQTWTNWEMIIVNDGSTDQSSSVINRFVEKDHRIHLYDRKNVGIFNLSKTYNFALAQCKGDFIAILEGDDFWVKDKLEIQVSAMQEDPESILCWGKAYSIIENNPEVYETHPKCDRKNLQYYSNKPTGSFFNIVFDDFPAPLTFLIKKEALMKTGQFQQILPFPAVDLPTILALSMIGPFHYIPKVLGSWRQHSNQITKNNSIELLEGSTKIIVEHYKSLTPNLKKIITFDLRRIEKNMEARKVIGYSRSGRFNLIKKRFKVAREDYKKALISGHLITSPSWKLRSLIGLILSYFRMDVEGLAKIMGKKSYK